MYEKNSKALNEEDLEKAAGGGFYVDNRWNAIKAAKSRGIWDDEISDNELNNFITNMKDNGYVDVNGKRYYIDGHSA